MVISIGEILVPIITGILFSLAYFIPFDLVFVSPLNRGILSAMRVVFAAFFLFMLLNSPGPRSILMGTLFVLVLIGTFLVRRRF